MNYLENDYIKLVITDCQKNGRVVTEEFGKIIKTICTNVSNCYSYTNVIDKEDCISHSQLEVLLYWHKYDPERSSNAFAFITSIAMQGLKKGFKKLQCERSVKAISLEFIDIKKI